MLTNSERFKTVDTSKSLPIHWLYQPAGEYFLGGKMKKSMLLFLGISFAFLFTLTFAISRSAIAQDHVVVALHKRSLRRFAADLHLKAKP